MADTDPTNNIAAMLLRRMPALLMLVGLGAIVGLASGLSGPPSGTRHSRVSRSGDIIVTGGDQRFSAETELKNSPPYAAYRQALEAVKGSFYGGQAGEAGTRSLTNEAIKGMLASLNDPFSSYLPPAEWNDLVTMTEGRFGGIGALLEQGPNGIRIAKPMPGGPAERAGLKENDLVNFIDGHAVPGKTLDELGQWIQGDPNTPLTVQITRGGRQMTIRVIRANIEPPVVEHWMEDETSKIGHIVLTEFNRKSREQVEAAYSELEKHGMRALVFDLRFNPGGLLDAAVDVASLFIPEKSRPELRDNVVIIHRADDDEEGLTLEPLAKPLRRVPLAVLVNSGSASAAEIVTGAIKDYGAGEVIGERTFGKGKVQTLFEMNHGRDGGIRLTTSLYYPPKRYDINFKRDDEGNRIPGTGGIVPDLCVTASPQWHEDFEDKQHDNQLNAALDFLRARLAGKTVPEAGRVALRLPEPTPGPVLTGSGGLSARGQHRVER